MIQAGGARRLVGGRGRKYEESEVNQLGISRGLGHAKYQLVLCVSEPMAG